MTGQATIEYFFQCLSGMEKYNSCSCYVSDAEKDVTGLYKYHDICEHLC